MNDSMIALVSTVLLGFWAIALWMDSIHEDQTVEVFDIDEDF